MAAVAGSIAYSQLNTTSSAVKGWPSCQVTPFFSFQVTDLPSGLSVGVVSVLTLRGLGTVGHIRVYAALASLLSAAIIAVGITDDATAWIFLRLVTGLCFAGLYVVAESWLNDLADNQNRGRLLAVYGVITIAFYGVGQVSVSLFNPVLVTGFAVAAIVTALAVAPVSLSAMAGVFRGGRLDGQPATVSLGLLPSGPDKIKALRPRGSRSLSRITRYWA